MLLLLLGSQCLWAHGISHTLFKGGVGIQVSYDDGSPLSYAEVTIYSPSEKQVEFQTGMTDKNGRFVFSPDESGDWLIKIDDGMGHGLVKKISVESGQLAVPPATRGLSRGEKILIGVSLIAGLTGLLYGISVKKQIAK